MEAKDVASLMFSKLITFNSRILISKLKCEYNLCETILRLIETLRIEMALHSEQEK